MCPSKKCILLLLSRKFCIHLWCHLVYVMLLRSTVYFCLDILFIIESELLKSTISALLSISPFRSVNIYTYIYLGALMFGAYIYICNIFILNWPFYHYILTFVSRDSFELNILSAVIVVTPALFFSYHLLRILFSFRLLSAYVCSWI